MSFVDEARIFVKAGDGGKGCDSFYRDKYMRHARPDGGDGGPGGNIVFIASSSVRTLLDYKFKQHYKADNGKHGGSKEKKGRRGKDCLLRVPMGTLIRDDESGLLLRDLTDNKEKLIVVKGGLGGRGNANKLKSAPPKQGQQARLRLELKLMADVGIIGFPNAGKSSLVCAVSKVRSKIGNYPFTTKQPVLGFVENDNFEDDEELDNSFVIADLPGIIEDAHKGRGLGDRFLRHAERTKILVHMIDMAATECRDPLDDYEKIQHELNEYGKGLSDKELIIVANKMDLPEAENNLARFKKKYKIDIIPISSQNKQGLDSLIKQIRKILCRENSQEK